jgi:hypothetical protein
LAAASFAELAGFATSLLGELAGEPASGDVGLVVRRDGVGLVDDIDCRGRDLRTFTGRLGYEDARRQGSETAGPQGS